MGQESVVISVVTTKKSRLNEKAQASLEFALVLSILVAFIFFYIQLCLVFAWGNYVHYATFMAARAYQAAGYNREDQISRAKNVLARAVKRGIAMPGEDRLPLVARGVGGEDPAGVEIEAPKYFQSKVRNLSWMEGVRYTFRSRLFLIPLAGSSGKNSKKEGEVKTSSVNSVTLTSESWLGREPNYDECMGYMKQNFKNFFIDNGC